jgi:hypothetical protein
LHEGKAVEHARLSEVGVPNVHILILSCSRRRQSKGGDISMWQLRMVMDDIAYDYISYLIQMSSLLINEPTPASVLAVHTMRTSMGVYTFISHRLTF